MSKKKPAVTVESGGPPDLRETPGAVPTTAIDAGGGSHYKTFAALFEVPEGQKGVVVAARLLEGGDVELTANGNRFSFEDGIILRWGRKR